MATKAMLIHSADAWTDNGTLGTTADDGLVNGSEWNASYGWGSLDLRLSTRRPTGGHTHQQWQRLGRDFQQFEHQVYRLPPLCALMPALLQRWPVGEVLSAAPCERVFRAATRLTRDYEISFTLSRRVCELKTSRVENDLSEQGWNALRRLE